MVYYICWAAKNFIKNPEKGAAILNNTNEIGKILIDNEYPFALIKFSSENFDTKIQYKSENAIIKINLPNWIK